MFETLSARMLANIVATRVDLVKPSTPLSGVLKSMSAGEDALAAAATTVVILCLHRRRRRRRVWTRPSLLHNRNTEGHLDLVRTVIEDDVSLLPRTMYEKGVFEIFFRITKSDFEYLLHMIGPTITKEDTRFRQPISASDRLGVTLRFLATGDSYSSLGYSFKMSKQAISRIVPEVCDALITALSEYIKVRGPHTIMYYTNTEL